MTRVPSAAAAAATRRRRLAVRAGTIAVVLAILVAPAAAWSFEPGPWRLGGGEALRLCGADAARHCTGVTPGGGRLAQCLIERRAVLEPGCRSFLDRAKSAELTVMACAADARRLCPGVAPGGGRMIACLEGQRASVSPACIRTLDAASEQLRP
ncbi:cysteine rich repeat-containing protein [Prosthecodimorpha staleyi]|uniref:Cysteine rich repeat-containing protein n=1 Tax=Prosthecodimorpha staleyi TaxID=2840188 RepID=A0A947GGF0_9HYPH|nr:cysteine rich repeat-containing protein [Prosthecodimorpha staleyi]MBT9292055.1 cysteine rich repeat-containing protein [Prosthecodimorpha staleyi]